MVLSLILSRCPFSRFQSPPSSYKATNHLNVGVSPCRQERHSLFTWRKLENCPLRLTSSALASCDVRFLTLDANWLTSLVKMSVLCLHSTQANAFTDYIDILHHSNFLLYRGTLISFSLRVYERLPLLILWHITFFCPMVQKNTKKTPKQKKCYILSKTEKSYAVVNGSA